MTNEPAVPALTGMVTIDVPIERAFQTFTRSFNSWWPAQYHIGRADGRCGPGDPRRWPLV
jgi:hypothetical protein